MTTENNEYDGLMEQCEIKFGEIIDPKKFLPLNDPNDPLEEPQPDLKPILKNVQVGKPKKMGFYKGTGGILLFSGVLESGYEGINQQFSYDIINGALIIIVPGDGRDATLQCLHYSNLVKNFLKDKHALDMDGVTVKLIRNNPIGWRVIDVNKFAQIKAKEISLSSTGVVAFEIKKIDKDQQIPKRKFF
jgi:hypothetical protein